MIKTYKNKGLMLFAEEGNARKLSVQNPERIKMILDALAAATKPGDMDLPGLRFHPAKKSGHGRYAVDASGNWRITFAFEDGHAVEVDLEDYH